MTNNTCKIAHITDLHLRDLIPGTSAAASRQSRLVRFALRDLLLELKQQHIDVLIITGDLVDVELPHEASNDDVVLSEYKKIKEQLDESGLRYHVIPGNHDEPNLLSQVFGSVLSFELNGYEFISFYDHQEGSEDVYRHGESLEQFQKCCAAAGPRNQIHLQHYLIYPEHNEGFPHTYANADVLMKDVQQSERVLLSVSGHYHHGCNLDQLGKTYFYTGQSFTEQHFPYALISIDGEYVDVEPLHMKSWCLDSPIHSTYQGGGQWYHGNLHMHCEEHSPCSVIPLETGVEMYAQSDHSFMALTDHDVIAKVSAVKKLFPKMIFYEGFEHSVSNHMLFIHVKVDPLFEIADKKEALQQAKDYLSIVCHPQGPKLDYWTVEELLNYPVKPTGVEVFNGHYGVGAWREKGSGWDYTDFWSACLDAGLRFFAYANDDFHDGAVDFGNGWNVVLAQKKTAASLLMALKTGACYATTGLLIKSIQEYRGHIVCSFDQPVTGRFVGPGNETLSSAVSDVFEYSYKDEPFIRFEAERDGQKCWTQPMFAVAERSLQSG